MWRRVAVRAALLAVPAWFTLAALIFPGPLLLKAGVALVLFTSLIKPENGLLVVAVAAPLGQFAAPVGQFAAQLGALEGFRVTEALVVAFVTGWLLRAQEDRPGPRTPSTAGRKSLLASRSDRRCRRS